MQLLQEFRVGQNMAAVAILLQILPVPEHPSQKDLHRQVKNLVELAAIQQAASSSLHHRQAAASCPAGGAGLPGREPSEVLRSNVIVLSWW